MRKINFSMTQRFKVPALSLATALVFMALPAVAQAQFTSNKEHSILSGSQKTGTNDVFTAGSGFGGITCENATFSGTAIGKSESTQAITPSYSTCKDSFGRTVDIDNKELTYSFTSGGFKGEVAGSGEITLTVTSGGSVICTVVLNSGPPGNGITYTNLGGTKGVEVTAHATNIVSTTSGGFFNCGISNGEHKAGTYDGVAVVTGKDTSSAAAEISVD
jgi:hypothetical protein